MALKLNIERTYKHPVTVNHFDETGKMQTGSFVGVFRVTKADDYKSEDKRLIDIILVGVEGLELLDEHGNALVGNDLLDAVRNDTELAMACIDAYNGSVEKKRVKGKTSDK